MAGPKYYGTLSITVPGTTGTYTDIMPGSGQQAAPQSVAENTSGNLGLLGITAVLSGTVPSSATLELWYLSATPNADPTNIANYLYGQSLLTAIGGVTVPLASVPGVLIRAKSGGTGGTATVSYWADG